MLPGTSKGSKRYTVLHVSFSNRFWVSILDPPHRVYRLRPTFPVFLLVACERNAVFRIFCISLTSDRPFSPFFARRSRATNDFQHFQSFPRGGKSVLAVISFSLAGENRFLLFSCFLFIRGLGRLFFRFSAYPRPWTVKKQCF